MSPPLVEIGGKQRSGEAPQLRHQPPPKPVTRGPRPAAPQGPPELDTVHVEVELPEPTQAIVVRPPRAASRPDDSEMDPFVTYRLDKLDRAVEKLDDDGTRVEAKVDGLAVKVDDLAEAVRAKASGETSRKAFWTFMTAAVAVAGTMFSNYMSKPNPAETRTQTVILRSGFDKELDECRKKPESVQDDCVAQAYRNSRARQ